MCARFRAGFSGTLCFLLTAKSSFMCCFMAQFVFPGRGNVAHFFPFRALHLDLAFWVLPVLLTMLPSQGMLTTAVYRRSEQEKVRSNGGYRF